MPTSCPECGGPMARAPPAHHPEDGEGPADEPAVTADPEQAARSGSDRASRLAVEDVDVTEGAAMKTVDQVCSNCGAVVPMAAR